jgi:hypothetical protein
LSVLGYANNELPIFKELSASNFVTYGEDDLYGEYLRDLYLTSSTHNAIVNGVAEMIYGEGIDATDRDESDGKREAWLRLQALLNASDKDLLRKMALDLKLYGMTYVNTIWNRGRTRINKLRHLPVHQMRSGMVNGDGVVDLYYHKTDWSRNNVQPTGIKAFDPQDRTEASQVLLIKRYTPSYHYYSLPDYVGSTNYIELDREIGQFHVNNIKNGLFPSMLLSFKNGVPTDEERADIERKVLQKFSGADNAGRILITFNDGDETAPEFTTINSNDADGMFQYLSGEVAVKILTGHRCTSPLLFGIRGDGSGFGNNADELRDSYSLFNNTVILPFQNMLLDGLQPVLDVNGIELDLYFRTLKPADFLDIEVAKTQSEAEAEKEGVTNENLSKCTELSHLRIEAADYLTNLGEDEETLLEQYDVIDSRKVEYEHEAKLDALWNFASALESNPDEGSKQDTPLILVRYRYRPNRGKQEIKNKSRSFCVAMTSQPNKVYRKEDIEAAGSQAVNPGWGPRGANTYSIWLYKGGGNCQHFWERRTYLRKGKKPITVKQAERIIREAGVDEPRMQVNEPQVAKRPRDMDNAGFLPSNPRAPKN